MAMTRKHYVAVADDLNAVLRHSLSDTIVTRAETVWLVAIELSHTFKYDNHRFDTDRFMDAVFKGYEGYRPNQNRN